MSQKKSLIKVFFEGLFPKSFGQRLSDEIYWKIFPQAQGEADYGYPFTNDEELIAEMAREKSELLHKIKIIEQQADSMGKGFGEAFRYVMYHDLNKRMSLYAREGKRQVQPRSCDPQFVASKA